MKLVMSEQAIEQVVCHRTDSIDRRYMAGSITEDAYKKELADLSRWADAQYAAKRLP